MPLIRIAYEAPPFVHASSRVLEQPTRAMPHRYSLCLSDMLSSQAAMTRHVLTVIPMQKQRRARLLPL